MNKTSVYTAIILVVLAAAVYFSDSPEEILGTADTLENTADIVPFAVAQGTTTTHFKENGQISYTFNAQRLEHYRDENENPKIFTLVDDPVLIIYQNDEPWFVRAKKGKINTISQQIELWQNVSVNHTTRDGITTNIFTARLDIDPIKKFAQTQEPVRITSDKVEMRGIGMTADLIEQELRLLSKVIGTYDPT